MSVKKVVICSDSMSALQSLKYLNIDHPIVLKIVTLNHSLQQMGFEVIYTWVPGHMDITGNEKADKAAKQALA